MALAISKDRIEAWMRQHVDAQPPLTTGQREKLAAILGYGAKATAAAA